MPPTKKPALLILNDPHSLRICGELAEEIGFQSSVVLLQLEYLIRISTTKEYEGNIWTYQSLADLKCGYFPWWKESTILRILDALFDKKLILYGNFNKNKQDRTRWYALNWPEIAKLTSVKVDESILQNAKWVRRQAVPRRQIELPDIEIEPELSPGEKSILQIATPILQNATPKPLKCTDHLAKSNDITRDFSRESPEISPEIPGSNLGIPTQQPAKQGSREAGSLGLPRVARSQILDPQEVWNFVIGQLQPSMPRSTFETWVVPIRVRGVEGDAFVVEVANGHARELVINRLQKLIENMLAGVLMREMRLVVLLPGEQRLVCTQTLDVK